MENIIQNHIRVSTLVAGTLLGLGFIHVTLSWLAVFGLCLLWVVIGSVSSARAAFGYGVLAGLIKMLFVLSWFWSVYPLDWLADFNRGLLIFGIFLIWMSVSAVIGVGVGVFAYGAFYYRHHPYRFVITPLLLVISEIIGSLIFSLYSYGPGASINAHFSFGYLGYILAHHDLLGLGAVWGGVYTLSFLVALISLVMYEFYQRYFTWTHIRWLLTAAVVVILVFATHTMPSLHGGDKLGISVTTINTDFERGQRTTLSERAAQSKALYDSLENAISRPTDYVLFPEIADGLKLLGSTEKVFSYLDEHASSTPVIIDSDSVKDASGRLRIRAHVYDSRNQTLTDVYKTYLIPNGEFLPYFADFVMRIFGFNNTATLLDEKLMFAPQNNNGTDSKDLDAAVLFCSESVSPIIARQLTRTPESKFIVHQISHGWFNTPHVFWHQLDAMLRTQVRFAGKPLVQAANRAESKAYDRLGYPIVGKVISETEQTNTVRYEI